VDVALESGFPFIASFVTAYYDGPWTGGRTILRRDMIRAIRDPDFPNRS